MPHIFHTVSASYGSRRSSNSVLVDDDQLDVELQRPWSAATRSASKMFLVFFTLGVFAVLGLGAGIGVASYHAYPQDQTVSIDSVAGGQSVLGRYRFAAAASDAPECSTIATELLARGGSAVDAAIGGLLCAGVLNLHSNGVGGGSFMLIYDRARGADAKSMRSLDFRETTPAAGTSEFYNGQRQRIQRGPFSIGVPGEVAGYYEAWQQYGRLPWPRLFRAAIRLCREGYRMREPVYKALLKKWSYMKDSASWRELLVKPDGRLYQTGDMFTNPRLADTLQTIADHPQSFYTGDLAHDILLDLQDAGSHITADDLAGYAPSWKSPQRAELASLGLTSYTMPPPSSGPIMNFMLRLFEGFGHTAEDNILPANSSLLYHHVAEIFKFGFAERTRLGDPAFVNVTQVLSKLNTDKFIDATRTKITDSSTHDVLYYDPVSQESLDGGTSHLSVLAGDGSAVAATSTINGYFGSYIRGRRTGIIFNNELDDFALEGPLDKEGLPPPPANLIAPGKRPLSSMIPTIMLDQKGDVRHVIGASGGKRILTAVPYVALHNLWLDKRIDKAVNVPRLHHTLTPNVLVYESQFPKEILDGLSSRGHVLEEETTRVAIVQAIRSTCGECTGPTCQDRCIMATSDYRKKGAPDGY